MAVTWDDINNTINGLLNDVPEAVAKALGLWTAARAAIGTVATGLAAAATQTTINEALAKYQDRPLSAADLADMIVRNVLPDSTGASPTPSGYPPPYMPNGINAGTATEEAALTGISGDRFAALVYDTGESYGLIDAARLYNLWGNLTNWQQTAQFATGTPLYQSQGDISPHYGIDEEEFFKVLAYSRVRPQFTDDILRLRYHTISGADAVELAVKEIISVADARSLYQAAGGMPEQFELLYRGAGDAAGLQHATELLAHNVITPGRMDQIIGMSRLNPAFYDLYKQGSDGVIPMHLKWLPPFELQRAVVAGLLTQDEAITTMTQDGFTKDQATLFFQTASLERIISLRGVTEAQVAVDWQAGLITQSQAETALRNIGYQDWALPIIFDTYEARKVIAARNNVVTRVRQAVIVGGLTSAEAVSDLESVGFSPPAASEMVADWTVEANTPTKMMSYSVVGYLLEAQLMGKDDGINYFRRSGYTAQDAELMVAYYQSGLKTPPGTVTGTHGPLTEETPEVIPPPPTRLDITELGPTIP